MEELKLLRKIARCTKDVWDRGGLPMDAITLRNLLTDYIDFNTHKEKESAVEADAESRCPECGEAEPDLHCSNCGHSWYRTA